jgi:hypothetical protein
MRLPSKTFVDLTILGAVGVMTLVTVLIRANHVDIKFPITEAEAISHGLRGNYVNEGVFHFGTAFAWFGTAYYFAGRWAERNR